LFFSYQDNEEKIKPLIRKKLDRIDFKIIFKKLLPNTYKQGLISISNYINLNSITILSSAFLSLKTTASLGLVLQIISIITGVANTFFNTFLPQFSSYRVESEYKLLKKTFKKAILINYLITFISFIILIFAGNIILGIF